MSNSKRNMPRKNRPTASPEGERVSGTITERLEKATTAYHRNDNAKLQRILDSLAPQHPFSSPEQNSMYNRLLAFAQTRAGRYLDAEQTVMKGLQADSQSADLLYALAFIKTTLREYDEAIATAEKYLVAIDLEQNQTGGLATSDGHRAQLLNYLATGLKETDRVDQAIERFEQAIVCDPGNHLPYLNLAALLASKKRMAEAEEVVQRGVRNCKQINELRMVLSGYDNRTTISACMIVKNEEEMLEDCLKSIRDWVDEIILVDTGSTDRTVAIAEQYGAKVFHQPWEGDFSKARNYSLEQATSEWIFIIDADERIFSEDVPQIIRFLNGGSHELISINVINVYGDREEMTTFLPSERFFKRSLNLRYKGIVHNQLDVPSSVSALRTPIRLKHLGYGLAPEKMRAKMARSRALLESQLDKNPDNAFAHFNLAQLLRAGDDGFAVENCPDIIEHATKGVQLTDPDKNKERHIHLMCLDQLGWAHFHAGDYNKSEEFCHKALSHKADYLDPLLLLGHIAMRKHDFAEGIKNYEKYLQFQAQYNPSTELANIILFHVDSRASAYYSMAIACLALERKLAARDNFEKTVRLSPVFLDANARLGRLLYDDGLFERAEECFKKQLDEGEKNRDAALGLAAISARKGNPREAIKRFEAASGITPNDPVPILKHAEYLEHIERTADAVNLLDSALKRGLWDPELARAMASMAFGLGEFERAAGGYELLIENNLGSSEVYNDLGNCHFKLERYDIAEENYQKSLECSHPVDLAYRNLGLTRLRLERPKEAIWALERFVGVNPSETELLRLIAELYVRLEDYSSALNIYEKFLAANPSDLPGIFGLSECYLHMGHTDSAILGYRRVLEIDPEFRAARERLGSLSQAANREAEPN